MMTHGDDKKWLWQAGTRFTYTGGMEGWVDLGYPAMHRPGSRTRDLSITNPTSYHYTTEPPSSVDSDKKHKPTDQELSAVYLQRIFSYISRHNVILATNIGADSMGAMGRSPPRPKVVGRCPQVAPTWLLLYHFWKSKMCSKIRIYY